MLGSQMVAFLCIQNYSPRCTRVAVLEDKQNDARKQRREEKLLVLYAVSIG
jgi:hypothetical protein